ncbi:hypothetical protein GCM10010193_05150 [Kitasatospora atroaurantiaca]|uniref:Cytochrome c domain-containing protein n=1 Tax=Kitasatospora atroaurantiaca TaxID=285545 RepID=A0A561EM80_9ACTN|nr:hypothetical protein [Kitasatospora atroaurantiaca]TWE16727.1 hypothetical protein FB465_1717 [Kitasatospora atroaurantiaca]
MLLPATADEIVLLEAVRITDSRDRHLWTDTVPGERVGLWDDAQEVLALIRDIPASEPMRCFSPGYAIRAHAADGKRLFDIAFCFRCHRAVFYGPDAPAEASQTMDPTSAPALELLRRFRESAA